MALFRSSALIPFDSDIIVAPYSYLALHVIGLILWICFQRRATPFLDTLPPDFIAESRRDEFSMLWHNEVKSRVAITGSHGRRIGAVRRYNYIRHIWLPIKKY